jgi:hypothetical protein
MLLLEEIAILVAQRISLSPLPGVVAPIARLPVSGRL